MKKLSVIIFMFIALNLSCGTISVRGLYNYNIHVKYEESSDDVVPEQFQYTAQIPGIGQFYNNNSGYNLELTYCHPRKIKKPNFLIIGGFSQHSIESKEEVFDYFFGERINISKLYLAAGRGHLFKLGGFDYFKEKKSKKKDMYIFVYYAAGPVMNFYSGETNDSNWKLLFEYNNSITFRFNSGIEIPIWNSIFLNLSLSYDLGNIGRGNLTYYFDNEWVADAEPIGESTINDDQFLLSFGLTWNYDFGGKNELK